jgi:creatinine amidohydrolase
VASGTSAAGATRGLRLADLTWIEAERAFARDPIVVIPIGAGAKELGPHLRLDNDLRMADAFAARVLAAADVVIAPTLPYHFYPAFVDYPGSTTLRFETARDLVVDVVRSLAHHGPRRFYALNTGLSTLAPLEAAREIVASEGIALSFTDLSRALAPVEQALLDQEAGTHADEGETSMMLALAPDRVDMSRAVRDIHDRRGPKLTRDPDALGRYSPSGVYGDATLASREKGEALVAAVVRAILADLDAMKTEGA